MVGLAKHGTRSEFNFRHVAGPDRLAYAKLNETITSAGDIRRNRLVNHQIRHGKGDETFRLFGFRAERTSRVVMDVFIIRKKHIERSAGEDVDRKSDTAEVRGTFSSSFMFNF